MDIFGNGDEGAQEMCDSLNCERRRAAGSKYCDPCTHDRMLLYIVGDDAGLQAWPTRQSATLTPVQSAHLDRLERELPATLDAEEQAQQAELVRAKAAPLFATYDRERDTFDPYALDRRCMWCCWAYNEGVHDAQAFVKPAKPHYTCQAHSLRMDALFDALDKIRRMRAVNHKSTAQIAVYYKFGYLGEYLHQQARRDQQRKTNR